MENLSAQDMANIGAEKMTNTILGVPSYIIRLWYNKPQKHILISKAPILGFTGGWSFRAFFGAFKAFGLPRFSKDRSPNATLKLKSAASL